MERREGEGGGGKRGARRGGEGRRGGCERLISHELVASATRPHLNRRWSLKPKYVALDGESNPRPFGALTTEHTSWDTNI